MEPKSLIRQKLLSKRTKLDKDFVRQKSLLVADKFIENIDVSSYSKIHCYLPALNEIDTRTLLKKIIEQKPDIFIATTPINDARFFEVDHTTLDQKAEPLSGVNFDLIIVPCVGFDRDLFRIGSGAGFYDRFLLNFANVMKIGVCYSFGYVPSGFEHEAHDIPMDQIITENDLFL